VGARTNAAATGGAAGDSADASSFSDESDSGAAGGSGSISRLLFPQSGHTHSRDLDQRKEASCEWFM